MRNSILSKNGTKYKNVSAALATLQGVVSIQEIIDAILAIDNLQSKTLKGIKQALPQKDGSLVPLSELYVDMTYQRRIRLRKIIKKIIKFGGFSFDGAGVIDIAERDGKLCVWDGLRRCIMAGLCGLTHIKATRYVHMGGVTSIEAQKTEAKLFKMRNADMEKMTFDEIFKSMTVYEDQQALEVLELLENCKLEVEGLNQTDDSKVLGGLKSVWDNSKKRGLDIDDDYFISASQMLHSVFPKDASISAYALLGLSWLLHQNTESDAVTGSYSDDEIRESLNEYVVSDNLKQKVLTSQRVNGKNAQSVAYHIAKNALNDTNGLMHAVIDVEDAELIEALA